MLTLWLVSILVFVATTALGDPVRAILGKDYNSDKARVAELTAQLNLDESLVTRYFHWLGNFLTGDFGTSIANQQPVAGQIGDNVVNTLVLVHHLRDRDDPGGVRHRDDLDQLPPSPP